MSNKFYFTFLFLLVFVYNAHASNNSLTPEQGDSLAQIIINIVIFLCGLFINPKKKSE